MRIVRLYLPEGLDTVAAVDTDQKDQPIKTLPNKREVYSRPKLREFGPVGALTQSGTGMQMENRNMMGPMRSPMN